VNIFPRLNVPKIYVFFDFIGMSPDQIEGFIVNELELYFQYVDGIQDIKSRNVQQVGLLELGFFPETDMGQAMDQVGKRSRIEVDKRTVRRRGSQSDLALSQLGL
jgi:multidrug efflux pump subunit AcrB